MCYLITMIVPAAAESALREQMLPEKLTLLTTRNPSVMKHFAPDTAAFAILQGACSCDLYNGAATSQVEKLRRKYQQKGWSEAKIQRALAGKNEPPLAALREDVVEFLQNVMRTTGRVSLLVHWYSGHIEAEVIDVKAERDEQGLEMLPGRIPEDTILNFRFP